MTLDVAGALNVTLVYLCRSTPEDVNMHAWIFEFMPIYI
jgi:hypothetical protein